MYFWFLRSVALIFQSLALLISHPASILQILAATMPRGQNEVEKEGEEDDGDDERQNKEEKGKERKGKEENKVFLIFRSMARISTPSAHPLSSCFDSASPLPRGQNEVRRGKKWRGQTGMEVQPVGPQPHPVCFVHSALLSPLLPCVIIVIIILIIHSPVLASVFFLSCVLLQSPILGWVLCVPVFSRLRVIWEWMTEGSLWFAMNLSKRTRCRFSALAMPFPLFLLCRCV